MSKKINKNNSSKEGVFLKFYKGNYKKFLILPIAMFLVSLFFIFQTIQIDGTPIYRDVSLKGGLSAIVEIKSDISDQDLTIALENGFDDNSFIVSELFDSGEKIGYIIDTDLDEDSLILFLSDFLKVDFVEGDNFSSNFISESLSNSFFAQAIKSLIFAFVLMSAVVFLYFRELVPSGAVVLSAIFDIIVTIGILDLFHFRVSVAGIGAFLMLIGYSIDTDILLTNRLIKERGEDYYEKTFFAFKTGTLMTVTTFIAGVGALLLTNSSVIYEIALILVIGLLVDYVSTWIQNASLLLWWIEKRN